MLDIIFPIVIFTSLAVIIFIVGKHLPDFRHLKKEQHFSKNKNDNPVKKFFKKVVSFLKDFFIVSAEWLVKQSKDALGLIHSQLLRLKGKKDKKTIITKKESQSHGYSPEEDTLKEYKQESEKEEMESFGVKEIEKNKLYSKDLEKKETSVDSFFDKRPSNPSIIGNKEEEVRYSPAKTSIWIKIKNKINQMKDSIKEYFLKRRRRRLEEVFSSEEESENMEKFSDGVVEGLERGGNKESINGNLIKEVVAVEKKKNTSSENDDDLGVDRKILEKKLINKIAQNPKDIENYRQLGELYLKMENYSDSLDCYKQVLKFKTRDVDAKRKIERINLLKRFK